MLVYLNQRFIPEHEAVVPVTDRGFLFGDGVYEVWRVVRGRMFAAPLHQARFERGLRELAIPQPSETTAGALDAIAERLLADNGLTEGEATLYLEVTRGAAPRTHAFPPQGTPPTVFAMARPFAPNVAASTEGRSAITVPDIRWSRCDIKTVQLLPNVMANQRAKESGAIEALFVRDGRITEGTHTNVFGVAGGVVRTHPADRFVLPGVTRDIVLELAAELGLTVREEPIMESDVRQLDELFVCGTTTDVTPVVRLDGHPVGRGIPGPVAAALYGALAARLAAAAPPAPR